MRAILSVLGSRMIAAFLEDPMNLADIPESPAMRKARRFLEARGRDKWLAEGKIEGARGALLTLLQARGLAVSETERATIGACSDPVRLDLWIVRAATATATCDVLDARVRRSRARAQ